MPVSQGLIQSVPSVAQSGNQPVLQGKLTEQIVAELHGKWYTAAYSGLVFTANNAVAGAVVGTATSTNETCFNLWNNSTSVSLELISLNISILATIGIGAVQLSAASGLGSTAGTGAPVISTGTPLTSNNNKIGTAAGSTRAYTVMSLTSAPSIFMQLGITTESSTAGTGAYTTQYNFDGAVVIPPGGAIFLTATAVTTICASATWAEVPI